WGLYWAVDAHRHCLLILQRSSGHRRSHRLPRLRGLSVEASATEDGAGERVIIRLTDGEQREVFHRFCVDVVEATRVAKSADEAVERFLARTWRWHRLLRSGQDGRLSEEEQKGLVGELRVIERYLLDVIDTHDAVVGWTGPLGAPKDFDIGLVGIEAKARSPQRAEVRISSVDQLDSAGMSRLFLSVIEVGASFDDSATAVTITDLATRVRSRIAALDMSAAIAFDERLAATGFDWEDDYSDRRWSIGDEVLYEVTDGFPRLTPAMVPAAVDDVRYTISMAGCADFLVAENALAQAISGDADGR
ncbi:MAG: PD-(D/E)XK motif protein, partial [Boseongicola sp.]|nr:PD-(D/E)XK motif protein [Boseongicola sp.]